MVTLPPPPPSTWEGVRTETLPGGKTRFTLAPGSSFLRITVDNLRPNHLITALVRIRTTQAGQYVVIRLGDDAKRFVHGTYYVHHVRTTSLGTSLIIEVTGIPTGVVEELTARATCSVSRHTIRYPDSSDSGGITTVGTAPHGRAAAQSHGQWYGTRPPGTPAHGT